MLSQNRIFALVVRLIGFAIGLTGLIFQFVSVAGFMANNLLVFFTLQTNIFTTAMFFALSVLSIVQLIKEKNKIGEVAHFNCGFQLAFTFYITITFVVYWTMLSWQTISTGGNVAGIISNVLVHGITPMAAMIESLLFLPHGKIKKRFAIWWLSYPLLYFIFTVIRANVARTTLYTIQLGGKEIDMLYPYFFIEPQVIGGEAMFVPIVLGVCMLFWIFAKLFIYVDRKIAMAWLKKQPEDFYYYIEMN